MRAVFLGTGGGDEAVQRWSREYLQQRHFTRLVAAMAFKFSREERPSYDLSASPPGRPSGEHSSCVRSRPENVRLRANQPFARREDSDGHVRSAAGRDFTS